MNTTKWLMIALLAVGLVGTGCGNKANVVIPETTSMPAGPVDLKVKWPAGRHGVQTMDMEMTMDMNMPWSPQPVKQETTMGQENALTVLPGVNGGQRALELELLKTRMNVVMGGKTNVSFDSTTSPPGDNNPAAGTLGKAIGAKIRLMLDDQNQVDSVQGADELLQRLTSSPAADPAGTLKNMFSGDALKLQLDFARKLAGHPVQPGDSWPLHFEYPLGQLGTLELDFTNTLSGWEKHHERWCAKIDVDGTMYSKPGENPEMAGMKMNFHEGTYTGETWFDLDMGMFVDGKVYQDMKIDITIPNPMGRNKPGAPKTVTINGVMHQTITTSFKLK